MANQLVALVRLRQSNSGPWTEWYPVNSAQTAEADVLQKIQSENERLELAYLPTRQFLNIVDLQDREMLEPCPDFEPYDQLVDEYE